MLFLSNLIGGQPEQAIGLFGLPLALPKAVRSAAGLLSCVVGALLAGVVLLVAVATVPTLFGYHTYVVSSGSMEPALRTGSIAVTSPSKPIGLKVGDIIAYDVASRDRPVLHRIVKIDEVAGERRFMTQGDSNAAPDTTPVTLEGAGDRVVYSVPYAGYVIGFAQGWGGRLVLIGVPAVLLAFIMGRDARRKPSPRADLKAQVERLRLQGMPAPLSASTMAVRGQPERPMPPDRLNIASSLVRMNSPSAGLVLASEQDGPAAALIASIPDGWLVRAALLHELLAS